MELKNSLEELGLSQNEIIIYLYLLSKGESLGNQIYKETLIDKSASYKALAQLERRELILSSGDARNQKYRITSKDKVLGLFEKRKQELETSKTLFTKAFADIEKYSADHYHSENVQIFTGADANEKYHKEILRGSDVTCIRTITTSETALLIAGDKTALDTTNEWFIKERVSKNISVRVLLDVDAVPDEYDMSNSGLLKECRRYTTQLNLNSEMSTFGDRVGFATLKNGKYWALILKDKLIVDLLNSMYDALWKDATLI